MCNNELETIKEVAITVGKGIDTAQNFGSFISKYIGGTLEQGMGIFEDKLKYFRWERQLRLMQRAEKFLNELGQSNPDKAIKLKYAIPLLQGATIEDDDNIQDMWAKLLVNASVNDCKIDLKMIYIDILNKIEPIEAKILYMIYELPFEKTQHKGISTVDLPISASIYEKENENKHVDETIELALANLSRLGCIRTTFSMGGGELFYKINPTILGKKFIDACTINK